MAYLYGASVQGIQGFIFQTNKLKEIVGASELVEQICTNEFDTFCQKKGIQLSCDDVIIKAAGNIKYLFQSDEDCKKVVREFPKHIANLAPGITISQAIVKYSENLPDAINALETKLKAQRSKVSMPVETGFMGLERDRRAGGVAVQQNVEKDEIICSATKAKIDSSKKAQVFKSVAGEEDVNLDNLPLEVEKITQSGKNSWLAIIHADGNALGILLQTLGKKLKENKVFEDKVKTAFSTFSRSLDTATKNAAQYAFKKVVEKVWTNDKLTCYPIRPVILGGDDLTVIIRADLALDFTIEFLKAFETQTEKQFAFLKTDYKVDGFENGITASAGIAFIKEKYPFHYGVDLAEKLTSKAKRFSKQEKFKKNEGINIPPSSISFYKVQSSFIESLDDMTKKTLTADISNVSFDFGPYLIKPKDGEPNVDMLKNKLAVLEDEAKKRDKSKGISKLRQWVSELYKDKSTADFMLERMKVVNANFYNELNLDNEKQSDKTIIYDLIQLHTLKY
ncbi:MAG: CRISPR-associated protein [Bacteroidota bacterium]